MSVNPIPPGYRTVTPYLAVRGASELLEFTKQAFGAEETECIRSHDGRVQHAEVNIGDSKIMLGEAGEETGPLPSTLYLYVDDVDAWFQRALDAGASVLEHLDDKFYGDRTGAVHGPCGNRWYLATHVEDVSQEEMQRRAATEMAKED